MPALRQHLDRQTALKEFRVFALEVAQFDALRRDQRVDEGVVLVFRERAVEVIACRLSSSAPRS